MTIEEVAQQYPEIRLEISDALFRRREHLRIVEQEITRLKDHYKSTASELWRSGNTHDAILLETSLVGQEMERRIKELQKTITNITAYLYDNRSQYGA